MLSRQGFDLWAGDYDRTVQISAESDRYPFAGYKQILNTIYNELMQESHSDILDVGFGTGVLTTQLYQAGHQIDGTDFSPEMIRLAREKMPEANLIEFDIHDGLPEAIQSKHYDAIVSSYTLHHLTDMEKVEFIQMLLARLKTVGEFISAILLFLTERNSRLAAKIISLIGMRRNTTLSQMNLSNWSIHFAKLSFTRSHIVALSSLSVRYNIQKASGCLLTATGFLRLVFAT